MCFLETHLPLPPKHVHLIVSHARVLLEQGRADLLVKLGKELLLPEAQGAGVMAADVFDMLDNEGPLGLDGDVVQQLGDRRQISAGEDVLVDETGSLVSMALTAARDFPFSCVRSPLTQSAANTPGACPRAW